MKNFPMTWKDIIKKYARMLIYRKDFSVLTKDLKGRKNMHTFKMDPNVYSFIKEMAKVLKKNESYVFDKIVIEYLNDRYKEIRKEEEFKEI